MASDDELREGDKEDGDLPPPLEDLSEQVKAIRVHQERTMRPIDKAETPEEGELKRRMVGEVDAGMGGRDGVQNCNKSCKNMILKKALLKSGQMDEGEELRIHSLESAAGLKLNGHIAKILSFNHDSGRYVVLIKKTNKKMRIKPENLRILEQGEAADYASFKKGFLESETTRQNKNDDSVRDESLQDEELPFIQKMGNGLRIPDVQKNVKDALQDPIMAKIIQEFCSNPQETLKKHGKNKEFINFIKAFMQKTAGFNETLKKAKNGTVNAASGSKAKNYKPSAPLTKPVDMGSSMSFQTADGNSRNVSKETMAEWMNNPYIRQALNKPSTQQMIAHLRQDPSAFARYKNVKLIYSAAPKFNAFLCQNPDLAVLIRAGIIIAPP